MECDDREHVKQSTKKEKRLKEIVFFDKTEKFKKKTNRIVEYQRSIYKEELDEYIDDAETFDI
jgi:hypothetical protein